MTRLAPCDGKPVATGNEDTWQERAFSFPSVTATVIREDRRVSYILRKGGARKTPLVLVHGFMAHAHWWDALAPDLAIDRDVVAIDLAGMGDSDSQSGYRLSSYVADLKAVLEALRIERCIIAGHSFGGLISGLFSVAHREMVDQLIVIDSNLGIYSKRANVDTSLERRYYPDLQTALSRFRLVPPSPHPDPLILDHIARHSVTKLSAGWTWKFDPAMIAELSQHEETLRLEDIDVPTDYVFGELSEVVTPELAEEALGRLSRLRTAIAIPQASHHLMVDQPIALLTALRALLHNTAQA